MCQTKKWLHLQRFWREGGLLFFGVGEPGPGAPPDPALGVSANNFFVKTLRLVWGVHDVKRSSRSDGERLVLPAGGRRGQKETHGGSEAEQQTSTVRETAKFP